MKSIENLKFSYPAEKLSTARRKLMAPHPGGEEQSFASAFHECQLALHDVKLDDLNENARRWVQTIHRTIDTAGVEDPTGEGTWFHKARRLSDLEKHDFSRAVDELASYFDSRFYGIE